MGKKNNQNLGNGSSKVDFPLLTTDAGLPRVIVEQAINKICSELEQDYMTTLPVEAEFGTLDTNSTGALTGVTHASRKYSKIICRELRFMMNFGANENEVKHIARTMLKTYRAIVGESYVDTTFIHTDLQKKWIQMVSVYLRLCMVSRVLKIYNCISSVNSVLAKRLVECCGFNYANIAKEIKTAIDTYDLVVDTVNKLILPKGIKAFDRWIYMCSNIFLDDANAKAQFIIFKPTGLYEGVRTTPLGADNFPLAFTYYQNGTLLDIQTELDSILALAETILYDGSFQLNIAPKLFNAYLNPSGLKLGAVNHFSHWDDTIQFKFVYDNELIYALANSMMTRGIYLSTSVGVSTGFSYDLHAETINNVDVLVQGTHRTYIGGTDRNFCAYPGYRTISFNTSERGANNGGSYPNLTILDPNTVASGSIHSFYVDIWRQYGQPNDYSQTIRGTRLLYPGRYPADNARLYSCMSFGFNDQYFNFYASDQTTWKNMMMQCVDAGSEIITDDIVYTMNDLSASLKCYNVRVGQFHGYTIEFNQELGILKEYYHMQSMSPTLVYSTYPGQSDKNAFIIADSMDVLPYALAGQAAFGKAVRDLAYALPYMKDQSESFHPIKNERSTRKDENRKGRDKGGDDRPNTSA